MSTSPAPGYHGMFRKSDHTAFQFMHPQTPAASTLCKRASTWRPGGAPRSNNCRPSEGNIGGVRRFAIRLSGVVWQIRAVGGDGDARGETQHPIQEVRRDRQQCVMLRLLSEQKFVERATRPAAGTIVVDDNADEPGRDCVVEGFLPVPVPALDLAVPHTGKVDLTELSEMRIVVAQHVHRAPTLIDELTQWIKRYALNHCRRRSRLGCMYRFANRSAPEPWRRPDTPDTSVRSP